MKYAPVVIFAYNRKDKLEQCIKALEANAEAGETEVFVFSDGSKNETDYCQVMRVRKYLKDYEKRAVFKQLYIVEAEKNQGLANSIIRGVTKVISQYGRIIVVEDDIIASPDFLNYMNGALQYYEKMEEYGSVSAFTESLPGLKKYSKDVYATRKGECWGWGTWLDRWEKVDWEVSDFEHYMNDLEMQKQFDSIQIGISDMLISQMNGEIDSWAVRWCYDLFRRGLLTVYPKYSRVKNIGFDGSGTHCGEAGKDVGGFYLGIKGCIFEKVEYNSVLEKQNAKINSQPLYRTIIDRIFKYLKK